MIYILGLLGLFCCLTVIVFLWTKLKKYKSDQHITLNECSELKEQVLILQQKLQKAVPDNTEIKVNKSKPENENKILEQKTDDAYQMNFNTIQEKQKLDVMKEELLVEKEKLEVQKIKYDEKIKKLWQQSTAIYKEKERISELHQNLAIEKQKSEKLLNEIQIKNKEITDNINYAQRIQSALLPDTKLINKALEKSFILYMPKDIVSGDFYAFAEKNGKVIIIAADCTGHGVSGAFMSMIGISLLNQIINERGVLEPAQILNLLNIAVIDALNQSENESNDGMDLSVCSIDLNSNQLFFAGANRPLWLIRNKELIPFLPNKFPIGGLQVEKERVFKESNIQLQTGDTFYIFTDGYSDQFGGEKGKKMMTAKFKEKLLSITDKSIPEQEEVLKNYFDEWKGDNEQVDDVLIIGVRV